MDDIVCHFVFSVIMPYICKKPIMETQINQDERIEICVSAHDKRMFKKAQQLSGDKTFSSFMVRILRQEAERIVAKNEQIIASESDRELFFDAVFGNSKPNQELIDAAKRYKSKTRP